MNKNSFAKVTILYHSARIWAYFFSSMRSYAFPRGNS